MLEGKKIVCYGDSNTWGYVPVTGKRYPKGVRWTSLLAEYTGAEVIEEGLNGRTTVFPDELAPYRTGSDYIEACVDSHSPFDLLIVMLGTNDMKTYVCNCADASAKGAARICRMARNVCPDIDILLVSPIVLGLWRTEMGPMFQLNKESLENTYKFGPLFEAQAVENGFYFLDAARFAEPSKGPMGDATHMDPENHKKLARAIADKVLEIYGGKD